MVKKILLPTLLSFAVFAISSWLARPIYAVTFNVNGTGRTGTVQSYTVPTTGTYTIEAWGASGGGNTAGTFTGGLGAKMKGDFSLNAGEVINILVGQTGGTGTGGSGGGGSFVVKSTGTVPLVIAGGGGGAMNANGGGAPVTNNGTTNGGTASPPYAGGGGGLSGNGSIGGGFASFGGGAATSYSGGGTGGQGGNGGASGGYGGGGGGMGGCGGGCGGGGGGGYNGGNDNSDYGDGGGSYNNGTNQVNTAGANSGNGVVTITAGAGGGGGGGALATAMGTTAPIVNNAWDYTMGYSFVPNSNGQITSLGGYFNGTKTVTLWNSAGTALASTSVTCANTWCKTAITPVSVTSGSTYWVGVYLAGSGGAYFSLASPQTATGITMTGGYYRQFNNPLYVSSNFASGTWYGAADVVFSTGGGAQPNLFTDTLVTKAGSCTGAATSTFTAGQTVAVCGNYGNNTATNANNFYYRGYRALTSAPTSGTAYDSQTGPTTILGGNSYNGSLFSATTSTTGCTAAGGGNYTCTAYVFMDATGIITETSEADNIASVSYTVASSAPPTPTLIACPANRAVSTGPTTVVQSNLGPGNIAVTSPANAQASDNVFSTTTVGQSQYSYGYKATGFGFSIPTTAVITGIVARASYSTNTATATTAMAASLTKNGTALAGSGVGEAWLNHNTKGYYDLNSGGGSPVNFLWGTTWTPAEINAATFGIGYAAPTVTSGGASATFYVDHFEVTVCYSTGPSLTNTAVTTKTATTATLPGTFNPNGVSTTAWFRYHTTNAPLNTCNGIDSTWTGSTRAPLSGGTTFADSTSHSYSQPITGLTQNTTYYFCAIGQNTSSVYGTNSNAPFSFTTDAAPPPTCSGVPASAIFGESIVFTASSSSGGPYNWSAPGSNNPVGTGINPFTTSYPAGSGAGVKTVTVTDTATGQPGNCTVTIYGPVSCSPVAISGQTGQLLSFTASGGNNSYSWTAAGGSPASGTGANFSTQWAFPGVQSVVVQSLGSQAGCSATITSPSLPNNACTNKIGIYCYMVSQDRQSFTIWAQLENKNDKEIYNKPNAPCAEISPDSTKFNYCVRPD